MVSLGPFGQTGGQATSSLHRNLGYKSCIDPTLWDLPTRPSRLGCAVGFTVDLDIQERLPRPSATEVPAARRVPALRQFQENQEPPHRPRGGPRWTAGRFLSACC